MITTNPVIVEVGSKCDHGGETTAQVEIDRAEWDAMTPDERTEYLYSLAEDHALKQFTSSWSIADASDMAATGELP